MCTDASHMLSPACAGWLPLVKMLIQHKADVCATSKAAQTALHFAAEMGHVDVVASLLDAAGKQLIVMKDQGNWTPLHHAAEQGSVDIVELLIFVSRLCTCCLLCMIANRCSSGLCSLTVNLPLTTVHWKKSWCCTGGVTSAEFKNTICRHCHVLHDGFVDMWMATTTCHTSGAATYNSCNRRLLAGLTAGLVHNHDCRLPSFDVKNPRDEIIA